MKKIYLLAMLMLIINGCCSSKSNFDENSIGALKDPRLLFAFKYLGEGISLGMISLEIKFSTVEYDKVSDTIYIKGQVIDETTKESVTPVIVYIGQKLEYDKGLNGYNIYLSDSVQADKNGFFELKSKLQTNTFLAAKVIGFYSRVYNICKLK